MDNAEFIRKQLIILGICIPAGYALLSFPFTVLALFYLFSKPLYGLGALTVILGYVMLGKTAWIRKSLTWTSLFFLISSTPLLWHFVVVPEMEKSHFRQYQQIPPDARIIYYRESGFNDVTRFCLVQHPTNRNRADAPPAVYRPFLPGALSIMKSVQDTLDIPDSRMPDPNKRTITYFGGENEPTDHPWMHMTVYDSATKQEWYFENGY